MNVRSLARLGTLTLCTLVACSTLTAACGSSDETGLEIGSGGRPNTGGAAGKGAAGNASGKGGRAGAGGVAGAGTGGAIGVAGASTGAGAAGSAGSAGASLGGSAGAAGAMTGGAAGSVDLGAGSGGAPAEICGDGLDQNGNGKVDETCVCTPGTNEKCFPGPPLRAGRGVCTFGTQSCLKMGSGEFATTEWGTCTGAMLGGDTEICGDGLDNDCDGSVDEDCGCTADKACATACGAGNQKCVAGKLAACDAPPPAIEICDGKDNDCNGTVDDVEAPCATDCGAGTQKCVAGKYGACSAKAPTAEVCNDGVDNDCDGKTDEDCTCVSPAVVCGDSCCKAGQTCCGSFCSDDPLCGKCPADKKACGKGCIPLSACCGDGDCPLGVCLDGVCGCSPGTKACQNACIATAGCCGDGECSNGKTCVSNACACGPGTKACGDTCVPTAGCCGDNECSGGAKCVTGKCECPPGQNFIGGQCYCAGTTIDTVDNCFSAVCTGGKSNPTVTLSWCQKFGPPIALQKSDCDPSGDIGYAFITDFPGGQGPLVDANGVAVENGGGTSLGICGLTPGKIFSSPKVTYRLKYTPAHASPDVSLIIDECTCGGP